MYERSDAKCAIVGCLVTPCYGHALTSTRYAHLCNDHHREWFKSGFQIAGWLQVKNRDNGNAE
jgi:hypothetical protein